MEYITSHLGELAALVTAICWTATSMAFESAGKKVGSLSVNLIRLVMALVLLGIFTTITRGHFWPVDAGMHAWFWLSLSGLVGFVIGDLLLFQAFVVIGARVSMLIMALTPPLAALFGWLILGEQMTLINTFGMVLTILGIALVILGRPMKGKRLSFNFPLAGLLLAFGGAAGQALGLVLSKLGMGDLDAFMSTQIRVIAGIIGFVLVFFGWRKWGNVWTALKNKSAMGRIGIGAFFGPFLGVSFSLLAVKYTTTGIASTLMALTPVMIILPARYIFKEKITTKEVVGAFIAVAGVVVFFVF
ncbi:DMT family transporter [Marinilabilia salmonicolor]|jgi:drug/metabolite transporter (DMT)-like permease|uniref:Putative membrane protein n=1 Tax=Marinilabilia salmonicolor TaxID=989 RepID=A0A2T0XQ16_9BACT|nr:DMT family transporter [Marinilabilia salmonicolor]PRZ01013.1 putative membrane protein [Marinilabilia salmonicolor]RCW31130.1 putative membrane protein [Marinilabilia salmonicolor]